MSEAQKIVSMLKEKQKMIAKQIDANLTNNSRLEEEYEEIKSILSLLKSIGIDV